MFKRILLALAATISLSSFPDLPLFAQETAPPPAPAASPAQALPQTDIDKLKAQAPRVFIDGGWLDLNYIKTEITYVNYVRDRKEADVHVLVTEQDTGSGGLEYTMSFIGRNAFEDLKNELKYSSNKNQTQDEVRAGLVQVLKMGLVGYAARTPIRPRLGVLFQDRVDPTAVEDKWDFWVFSASADGWLSGEKARRSSMFFANVSANRVTPESKLRLGFSGSLEKSKYDYYGYAYDDSSESFDFSGLYVKSLGEHWAAGVFLNVASRTFTNVKLSVSPAPAVEYNIFPYSESTRRQLRFLYKFNLTGVRYREMTIYDKINETRLSQSLDITLEVKEPWGTVEASVEGSHYFHDLKMNRIEFSGELSFRITKGLSLNLHGSYERIRDQLGLPKGEASLEEILLQRKELATGYSYSLSIGLSYTFGSIFSNVVNPRFGSSPGGMWGMGMGFYH